MGSGGSVVAMIQSLKANKKLLRKRYTFFDKKKDYLTAKKGLKINSQKATPEQIRNIKEVIRKQKRVEAIRLAIALSIIFPLIIFGVYQFSRMLRSDVKQENMVVKNRGGEKYQFHINDGDKMISKGKWNNAIFQYTRASEIFPNEFDGQYRLALAYSYKCKYTNDACERTDSLVNRLVQYFPDKQEVKELKLLLDTQVID